MLKEIKDVRQNAWKDAFNKMPIFDSIKNRLHDLEAKIGVITVNRVGRNKMTEDKEKEESQQEEMICEKDSKEEKKPRKKRGPNKKKESVGNKEEQGGEIKTEQREENQCNAQKCHQKDDLDHVLNTVVELQERLIEQEDENKHLYERLQVLEAQLSYHINSSKKKKIAEKSTGKVEAMAGEEKEGAQDTTNDLVNKEVETKKEVKRISLERQSLAGRFSKISNNKDIVEHKTYVNVDVNYRGVEYYDCLVLYGMNCDGELIVIVPGDSLKGAIKAGLDKKGIDELREVIREKGRILALASEAFRHLNN